MSEERWAWIPGYEGAYEVSDLGRVRSVPRVVIRSDGRRRPVVGGIVGQYPDSNGRLQANLSKQGKTIRARTHRLVLEAFVGPAPAGMVGCHNDGNEKNNRLDNLRWDSMSENQYDSVTHGTNWGVRKTHCPEGHAYEGENVMTRQVGRGVWRTCRTCANHKKRIRERRYRAAAKDRRLHDRVTAGHADNATSEEQQ